MSDVTPTVTLLIDGVEVTVPKGTNLIEAAKSAGIEIPHYCYHQHLSIAGNCRMCQVQVEGQPKLTIGCNTGAQDGMKVHTHLTSKDVAEAQRATLEFLLINHPLDCTVCDQAGHCKLQDYYYEYDKRPSRFFEEKVHKVKAEPVGPEVILDGERCILCTRCVRFCEEVTKTSELGVINRGDKSVIAIHPDKPLTNPLSGTVVDLCPVGALTHRRWRFNTRIWYTSLADSICPGCSTGCNVKAAVRDGRIVHIKARLNSEVNKEWLCDEGRYGFERFQARNRLASPLVREAGELKEGKLNEALQRAAKLRGGVAGESAVFISPFLTLEEIWLALEFSKTIVGASVEAGDIAMQVSPRELSEVEKVLISPDYAPNGRAAAALGLVPNDQMFRSSLERGYQDLLMRVRDGRAKRILFVGDFSVLQKDIDESFQKGVNGADVSVLLTPRSTALDADKMLFDCGDQGVLRAPHQAPRNALPAPGFPQCDVVLPSRTVNEKNGVLINRDGRCQRLKALLQAPFGAFSEAILLLRIAAEAGLPILPADVVEERAIFKEIVKRDSRLGDLSLMKIGDHGISPASLSVAAEDRGGFRPQG